MTACECNGHALLRSPGKALAWGEQHGTRTRGKDSPPRGLGHQEEVTESRKRIAEQPWVTGQSDTTIHGLPDLEYSGSR